METADIDTTDTKQKLLPLRQQLIETSLPVFAAQRVLETY